MKKETFIGADILEIEIDSNELKGGDSGHGGYTEIKFQTDNSFMVNGEECYELNLRFTGDSERINLRDALRFMADYLEEQLKYD
jgi:hypothetical protein